MKEKYDIFVSYRRSSFESANLIATRLRTEGYRVFFDVESLRGGKFNEQLFTVIDNCTDFLLILPPNALERCNASEDWVRKEVLRAIAGKKNIIPIMLAGFEWPDPMPQGMEDLPLYQAITASSVEYYDLSIRKLIEQYIKSKPKHLVVIKRLGLILSSVLLAAGLLFAIVRLLSIPLCNRVANEMTDHLVRLDLLGAYMDRNYTDWNDFLVKAQNSSNQQRFSALVESMSSNVQNTRMSINEIMPVDSFPRQYSLFESILFASRGLSSIELESEPAVASAHFDDYASNLHYMDEVLSQRDLGTCTQKTVNSTFELSKHSLAWTYYTYMEFMSKMPKKAKERYLEISSQFKSLPNDVSLTLTSDEYVQKQNNESATCEHIRADLDAFITNVSIRIDELDNKMSVVDGIIGSFQQIKESEENNATELAIRQDRIEAQRQINEQKKAQLEELNKEFQKSYEELKVNCSLEEDDDIWYQWSKIVHFATFMEMIAQNRKNWAAQGIYSTSSVTPEVAYATLGFMLNTFKEYHPEFAECAESAKAYYKDVSKGQRTISGMIICAMKDDMVHPVLQVGDIVLTVKGSPVLTFEDVKAALQKDGFLVMTFLRLSDGVLKEYKVDDCTPIDIIGFIELKQS